MIPRKIAAAILFVLWTTPAYAQVTVATDVAEDALSANSQPKLARAPDGTIYLTFVKRAGAISQIFVASSRDGRVFRLQQVTRAGGDSRFPSLAIGSDGRVHLTWTQYLDPVGKVYYAHYDGRAWSTPVNLSPGTAYAGVPAVATDLQQQPHVVWYGIRQNAPSVRTRHGSIYEILYSGLVRGRWSRPDVISPGIPDSINPGLAVDGAGTLHSAWYQSDVRSYQVKHAQRATAWEVPRQLTIGRGTAFAVSLAAKADSIYVVWEHKEGEASLIRVAEHHGRWSGPLALTAGGIALNPTVTVDDAGTAYVAWESEGAIYLRRKAAGRWQSVERLTRSGKHSHPILSTPGTAVDIAWVEDLGGERVVRFAALSGAPPGAPVSRTGAVLWIVLVGGLALAIWQYVRYRHVRRG